MHEVMAGSRVSFETRPRHHDTGNKEFQGFWKVNTQGVFREVSYVSPTLFRQKKRLACIIADKPYFSVSTFFPDFRTNRETKSNQSENRSLISRK